MIFFSFNNSIKFWVSRNNTLNTLEHTEHAQNTPQNFCDCNSKWPSCKNSVIEGFAAAGVYVLLLEFWTDKSLYTYVDFIICKENIAVKLIIIDLNFPFQRNFSSFVFLPENSLTLRCQIGAWLLCWYS